MEKELDLWYLGILNKVWKTFARTVQNTKGDFAKAVAKQFSGLKVSEDDVKEAVLKSGLVLCIFSSYWFIFNLFTFYFTNA